MPVHAHWHSLHRVPRFVIGFGLVMPSGAGVVPLGVFVCFVGLLVGRVADSFGGAVSSVRDGV